MWQALYEELAGQGFVVIAVAMDSRPGDPLPWIEAATPTYPALIDRDHRLAELYGIVNVPQAVWIDEAGRIVRPAEAAGAYEGFRAMNRATREMPDEVAQLTAQAKATYLEAIRDWVRNGTRSAHAFAAERARAHLPALTDEMVTAQALFRLGQALDPPGRGRGGKSAHPGGEPAPPGLLVHLATGSQRHGAGARRPAGLLAAGRRARRAPLLPARRHGGDAVAASSPPTTGTACCAAAGAPR